MIVYKTLRENSNNNYVYTNPYEASTSIPIKQCLRISTDNLYNGVDTEFSQRFECLGMTNYTILTPVEYVIEVIQYYRRHNKELYCWMEKWDEVNNHTLTQEYVVVAADISFIKQYKNPALIFACNAVNMKVCNYIILII